MIPCKKALKNYSGKMLKLQQKKSRTFLKNIRDKNFKVGLVLRTKIRKMIDW